MIVTQTGTACYDADFFPWGGELYVKTKTCSQSYKFTGKERDPDTNTTDYFGARWYQGAMGRFYTPDWAATAEPVPYAKLGNPQSLNLYAYVGNNPVSVTDVDGHDFMGGDGSGGGNDGTGGQGDPAPPDAQAKTAVAERQAQNQQAQQQNNLSNVVENETSSLKPAPNANPGQPGSAEDLAAGQLAVAEVANRVINAGHPGQVASSTLYDSEAAGLKRGDPAALDAHNRSMTAAEKAIDGSNTTNGATQYRTRIGSNVTTAIGRSKTNSGTLVSMHFGPFVEGKHTVVIVVAP